MPLSQRRCLLSSWDSGDRTGGDAKKLVSYPDPNQNRQANPHAQLSGSVQRYRLTRKRPFLCRHVIGSRHTVHELRHGHRNVRRQRAIRLSVNRFDSQAAALRKECKRGNVCRTEWRTGSSYSQIGRKQTASHTDCIGQFHQSIQFKKTIFNLSTYLGVIVAFVKRRERTSYAETSRERIETPKKKPIEPRNSANI